MRSLLLCLCLLLLAPAATAQATADSSTAEQKRLVYFTDKANSPYSITRPEVYLSEKALARRQRQHIPLTARDLPVNPAYVSGLKALGVEVWYTSRWFNAAVVQCNSEELAQIEALPYVRGSQTLNRLASEAAQNRQPVPAPEAGPVALLSPDTAAYGPAFHQADMLGVAALHADGFQGEGMTIAVLDAGFPAVHTLPAFAHLFRNGQLKGTFDFVQKQENVFRANPHGTAVLSVMAAYAPGRIIGTAYGADYLLLRTEDAASEHHIEEVNWLLAAEYADSAGADVLNSSLGYTSFQPPSASYTYSQLDGNTALVTKAADFAAAAGMLVVVSAGNEGNKPWQYLSAPADADSVLTVGAVDSLGTKAIFSSLGPAADGRIKPDVAALGLNAYVLNTAGKVGPANGTSFSAPIMAGFAAALWQAVPGKTNYEMIQLLRQIGSNAATPDTSIGYGIPNYKRALALLPHLPEPGQAIITNPVAENQEIILRFSEVWTRQQTLAQVYDTTGRLVYRQALPAGQTRHLLRVPPGALKQGLYLCRLRSGNRTATLRFIKL